MTPTNRAWLETIVHVMEDGLELRQEDRAHAPRDATTKELICHTVSVPMDAPLVTIAQRKLDYRSECAEVASILQDDYRMATIAQALAKDSGGLAVWPDRSLQWLIRDGQLHCVSTIRSSDVWLGLPSDLHTVSAMSAHLALVLKARHGVEVELGWLYNTAGSRHLYKRDWLSALECLDPEKSAIAFEYAPLELREFSHPDELVDHYWDLARSHADRSTTRFSWLLEAVA